MKTQMIKMEASQGLNNGVVSSSLSFKGGVLLMVLGLIYWNVAFSENRISNFPANSNNNIVTLATVVTEVEIENSLEVEAWMTNSSNWSENKYIMLAANAIEAETENALEVETWMTNTSSWSINANMILAANAIEAETENMLEVESWMINNNNWSENKYVTLAANVTETEAEDTLEVEGWMTNNNTWKLNIPAYCQHPLNGEKTPSIMGSELCMHCK